jgi:hypothetical protein
MVVRRIGDMSIDVQVPCCDPDQAYKLIQQHGKVFTLEGVEWSSDDQVCHLQLHPGNGTITVPDDFGPEDPITEEWLIENGFKKCVGMWFHKVLDILISDIYLDGTYIWTALPGKQMTKIKHLLALMIWLKSVQPPSESAGKESVS